MNYQEMTKAEFDAITERIEKMGTTWREFYMAGAPSHWEPFARFRYHFQPSNRAMRKMCRKFGGFDPAWPIRVVEFS